MKHIIISTLSLLCALALFLTGCSSAKSQSDAASAHSAASQSAPEPDTDSQGSTEASAEFIYGIPNPWEEYETQAQAEEAAGFTVFLPQSLPEGYGAPVFRTIPGEILEALYTGSDDAQLVIRVAPGTDNPSGDYNDYAEVQTATIDNVDITLKGNDGACFLAVWTQVDTSFSIGLYGGDGLSRETLLDLVGDVMQTPAGIV